MRRAAIISTLGLSSFFVPLIALAQTPTPTAVPEINNALHFEGVGNEVDKDHRNPILSVGIKRGTGVVSILADAVVQHDDFAEAPIQFDFFVNRKLFSSQIRSKALNGPVGVEVKTEDAAMPFNYSVMAKVIHPNRQFTSLIEGAVFPHEFNATLNCSLTVSVDEDSSKIYTQDKVKTVQAEGDSFNLDMLNLATASGSSKATLSGLVNVKVADSSSTATATLSVAEGSDASKDVEVSGRVTMVEGVLTSFNLTSSDGETEIECE